MILKITALSNISINDPVGIETVSSFPQGTYGNPIIEMNKNEYREYDVLDQQGNRLIPLLDAAQTAGMLTYTVVRPSSGGSLTIEDEGVSIEPNCQILDFIGVDVQAIAVGGNKVEIYHPPPIFSPALGTGLGALAWPTTSPGYVSRPEGGEGIPYRTGGLAVNTPGHPRVDSTDMAQFTAGFGITHTSPRVSNLQLGQIVVTMYDGSANTEAATLVLNPAGGDQIETIPSGRIVIRVLNTVTIGAVIEGEVHIWTNPAAFIGLTQSGTGGYFRIEVNHTAAPTTADFGHAFWDDGVLPTSIVPTIAPITPVVAWVSGIRHFDSLSSFLLEDTPINGAQHVVNMSIDNDAVILNADVSDFGAIIGSVLYSAATITGLSYTGSLSPLRTDRPRYSESFAVGVGNQLEADARARTTWSNFYGDELVAPQQSLSGAYQINTANRSTDSVETYDRETYRLQDEDVSNFKTVITDYRDWFGGGGGSDRRNWDATQSIAAGSAGHIPGLQFALGELAYPTVDYSSGYYYADFNYSTVVGACWFFRAFDVGDTANHKRFTITLEVSGITTADIAVGVGGDDSTAVRIDVLFPGQERVSPNGSNDSVFTGSGWLHCGKVYNAPVFTGIDNDGCMYNIAQVGSTITLNIVTGNMSSEYSDGTVILRIRYANGFSGEIGQTSVIGT